MLQIAEFQRRNRSESIVVTKHGKIRLLERNISVDDILYAISSGIIIKQYDDDRPLPSCLILGKDRSNRSLHLVVSHDDQYIYLITAYYPDPEIWSEDFTKKKE